MKREIVKQLQRDKQKKNNWADSRDEIIELVLTSLKVKYVIGKKPKKPLQKIKPEHSESKLLKSVFGLSIDE